MLQITSYSCEVESDVELDEYIPLKFQALLDLMSAPLYWRTGDFHKTLIEIGLVNTNDMSQLPGGLVYKITLVSLDPKCLVSDIIFEIPEVGTTNSLPICNILNWPENRFKDEPGPVKVYVGKNEIQIAFTEKADIINIYTNGSTRFGADGNGNLVLLSFRGLNLNGSTNAIRDIRKE